MPCSGDTHTTGCPVHTVAGPVCRHLHSPCLHSTLWPVPCTCLTTTAGALAAAPKPYQPPFGLDEPDKAVGARCKLFWPDDNEWYEGVIRAYSWDMGKHNLWYFYDEQVSAPEGLASCWIGGLQSAVAGRTGPALEELNRQPGALEVDMLHCHQVHGLSGQ